MNQRLTISDQVDVIARELSELIALLSDETGFGPVADAISAVESVGRLVDCARTRVLMPLSGDSVLAE